jgi:hypothetical protein
VPVAVPQAPAASAQAPEGPGPRRNKAGSQCDIDLSAVCDGQWVQNCEHWATYGLPCHDSLFTVISQLARWFHYVELWHIPQDDRLDKIIRLLQDYCIKKNNGFISRLETGMIQDVTGHVERAVMEGIKFMNAQGKMYCATMRQKRNRGQYKRIIYLEPVLHDAAHAGEERLEKDFTSPLPVGFICCTVLDAAPTPDDRRDRAENWEFKADDTPLPEELESLITRYYQNKKVSCYKPTMVKITRLINHLHRNQGQVRMGIKTLAKIGFTNHASRQHVQHLVDAGILRKAGEYSSAMGLGREYRLARKVMEMFVVRTKTKTA